ncbi:Aldo/keto reductase [Fomitopsis betulina]|nr:Aldo/keto reductase [Fomitopsis betulina]
MSGFFVQPPAPKTRLGRHRQLSPLAGMHVSPLCLGAMSIGDKWEKIGLGAMDKAASFKLLDAFYEAGGNFIDTANNYQDESSEEFIGEWMEQRGIRDQMVIATKYTTNYKRGSNIPQQTHYVGNNMKSLHGISDTPAWIVSKANMYARMSNKTPFVVYQGAWSILQRDFERDIIPMAREEGESSRLGTANSTQLTRAPQGWHWPPGTCLLGERYGRTQKRSTAARRARKVRRNTVAKYVAHQVAPAYVMQKTPVEHLLDNNAALEIALSEEQVKYLEDVLPFVRGFPHDMVGDGSSYSFLHVMGGHFDRWPRAQALRPAAT